MGAALAAGGTPGLFRYVLRATDDAIVAFNGITANTSNAIRLSFNATESASGLLTILDKIASDDSDR